MFKSSFNTGLTDYAIYGNSHNGISIILIYDSEIPFMKRCLRHIISWKKLLAKQCVYYHIVGRRKRKVCVYVCVWVRLICAQEKSGKVCKKLLSCYCWTVGMRSQFHDQFSFMSPCFLPSDFLPWVLTEINTSKNLKAMKSVYTTSEEKKIFIFIADASWNCRFLTNCTKTIKKNLFFNIWDSPFNPNTDWLRFLYSSTLDVMHRIL